MKFEEIMEVIKSLAKSQGSYGRLLNNINELDDESKAELKADWESRNFKDSVDFILYLES